MSRHPEIMQPRCTLCGKDFTPGRYALIAIDATHTEDDEAPQEVKINICDSCRQVLDKEIIKAYKIARAQLN